MTSRLQGEVTTSYAAHKPFHSGNKREQCSYRLPKNEVTAPYAADDFELVQFAHKRQAQNSKIGGWGQIRTDTANTGRLQRLGFTSSRAHPNE